MKEAETFQQMIDTGLLTKQISSIVGEANILADEGVKAYAVDGLVPKAVVFPGSVEELSGVMTFASEERLAVIPWGGGTAMGLGGIPERVDLVVSLKRLNRIIEHEPADLTASVQAGLSLREFQAFLGRSGQFLALDPPHPDRATIGGILAANSSGPRRLRYGSARDLLIGIKVVQADGRVIKAGAKVVKNVTGYDLNKLFIGSLGTLGIIVEANFKLLPLPVDERTYLAPFPSIEAAQEAVRRILDSPLVPSALEIVSPVAGRKVAEQAGLEWWGSYALAVSVGSVREAVDAQLETIRRFCKEAGGPQGEVLEGRLHTALWAAIQDFAPSGRQRATLKASVLLTKVPEVIRTGQEAATKRSLECAVVASAGSGIVRFYLNSDDIPGAFVQKVAEMAETVRTFISASEGSLIILDAPPEVKKRIDVWGPVGKPLALMQALKQEFDPGRILNPGRFVGEI